MCDVAVLNLERNKQGKGDGEIRRLWYNYRSVLHKEIDHEKTDTDIIIRADVYRMRQNKQ